MKPIFTLLFLLSTYYAAGFADTSYANVNTQFNTSFESAVKICGRSYQEFDLNGADTSSTKCDGKSLFYKFESTSNGIGIDLKITLSGGSYTLYGPFQYDELSNCDAIYNYTANSISGTLTTGVFSTLSVNAGFYILQVTPTSCNGVVYISASNRELNCSESVTCIDCVSSFSPAPGRYIVSAWVKEYGAAQTTVNYTKPFIRVSFSGSANVFNLYPSGKIIDGWQKIDSLITIPSGATAITIGLKVSSGDAYFDDIRFFPLDGSMMSYVYDPVNLRLMAELDERNYATFYEYDEEGKLIRIKKETEKGVMTIQENRDNILKH